MSLRTNLSNITINFHFLSSLEDTAFNNSLEEIFFINSIFLNTIKMSRLTPITTITILTLSYINNFRSKLLEISRNIISVKNFINLVKILVITRRKNRTHPDSKISRKTILLERIKKKYTEE